MDFVLLQSFVRKTSFNGKLQCRQLQYVFVFCATYKLCYLITLQLFQFNIPICFPTQQTVIEKAYICFAKAFVSTGRLHIVTLPTKQIQQNSDVHRPALLRGKTVFYCAVVTNAARLSTAQKGAKKRRNIAVASFLIVFNVIEWSCCVF